MKTIAFFNNRSGARKTSFVYHLAWMLGDLEHRILTVDLDPQANLSGMFLNEDRLEELWSGQGENTIDGGIAPLFEGVGDITDSPHVEKVTEKIGLLTGNLSLSKREDELSAQWPKCLDGDEWAFRVTTAFARLIERAGQEFEAEVVLVDVGPNLGAINRAALIASDYVVVPLVPDLFSLQGLHNVGPALREWREAWGKRLQNKPDGLSISLPAGDMQPIGYAVMRYAIKLHQPVYVYARHIKRIPKAYRDFVLESASTPAAGVKEALVEDLSVSVPRGSTDQNLLGDLKDYHLLMPLARDANKPMFMLKPADGVAGAEHKAVLDCYEDFKEVADEILRRIGSEK